MVQGRRPFYARWNARRNSTLARSRTRRRAGLKFVPARLMYRFSIDIAERNGSDLRRLLRSADRLRETAIFLALDCLKTPPSRSIALLVWVTRLDQRREDGLDVVRLATF
jgi:hypothetical protein